VNEAAVKREIVRVLIKEGAFARRLEDRYAIGTLDMILTTHRYMIYAEAKTIHGLKLMATIAQEAQIEKFNAVGNPYAKAIVVGYKDGQLGFGLPGDRWDKHHTCPWPTRMLADHFDRAVQAIFGESVL
jgi:hypothetical protein